MDLEVKTRVIKRNGEEVDFRLEKIVNAIKKANEEVENIHRMNDFQIIAIAEKIAQQAEEFTHAVNVEDIQDMVETGIMEMRGYEVAQKYVRYRYKRELTRKSNTTDNGILALIDHMNEEVKQENSNKNPVINSTQRDYMAGEVSKDLTKRVLLPEEIVRAHEEGIIHFHDMDYFAQKEHNCDLINLEDMLQNGTVISETMIEKPHSFFTACNVTTQIVAQVASNQYGGQSFTLSHLAPFVDVSRQKLRKSVIEERIESGEVLDVVVKGITNAGVIAYVEGVRGFIPASKLALGYVEDTEAYLNKPIQVQVIDVDKESKKLILSAKEILREKAEEERRNKVSNLEIGLITEGTVESLQPYGAFVDLGNGLSGLVHISQICEKRIKKPSEVLAVGDKVKVKVTAIKDGKLSLSIKEASDMMAKEIEEEVYEVPDAGEEATTTLGSLFANIKLD